MFLQCCHCLGLIFLSKYFCCVWITESHHVNISRVRESTALLLLACVCARRGGQETTATAAGCAGRGGAGRGGMASNGPQVRWRPDNTVTQLQHTQHTPSLHPGGPHPPADLLTSRYRGTISNRRQNPQYHDSLGKKIMEQEENFPSVAHESLVTEAVPCQCPHMVQ